MDEPDEQEQGVIAIGGRDFSSGRIRGAYGVARYEWGIGFSALFAYSESQLFSVRFHFGPLWLDVEILKKGWS